MERELLEARVVAWPFASRDALLRGTVELEPPRGAAEGGAAGGLWQGLERALCRDARGRSLRELAALRDHVWFGGQRAPSRRALVDLLCETAARWLEPEEYAHGGSEREAASHDERVLRWRALSLELPSDLLAAAQAARSRASPTEASVLLSPLLRETLAEGPLAETHLHLGAAVRFEPLWTGLVRSVASAPLEIEPVCDGSEQLDGDAPFGGGARADHTVLAACLVRLALARFVRRPGRRFEEHWRETRRDWSAQLERVLGALAPGVVDDARRTALDPLGPSLGRYRERAARLRRAYRHLLGFDGRPSWSLDDFARGDPLAGPLGAHGCCSGELFFLTAGLRYLLDVRNDTAFAVAFWQYARIRGALFRWLVQRPGVGGLDWFVRGFDRGRAFRGATKPVELEIAIRSAEREVPLASLEVRVAAEGSAGEVRREVSRLAGQALRSRRQRRAQAQAPRVGVLFHVIKRARRGGQPRALAVADPRQSAHGCRYGALAYEYQRQLGAMCTALRREPELLVLLRGIDVAGLELEVPTWVVAPLVRDVRRASRAASAEVARRWGLSVPPLRATYHAGEEFTHLLEGLRRVHELIEARALHDGDRIGHGLALGASAERWAQGTSACYQRREERLDDLLWLLDRVAAGDVGIEAGLLARLRDEAMGHVRDIYGPSEKPCELDVARAQRRSRFHAYSLGFPWLRGRLLPEQGLAAYLCDEGVYERGGMSLPIQSDRDEAALLVDVQRWLVGEVARREVTIEACLSSNLLISGLRSFTEHPIFALQPVHGGGRVAVSVNTDDPLVFATSLAEEHACVYAALRSHGVGTRAALSWLAERRRDGYRSRFTVDESSDERWLERLAGRGG